MRHFLVFGSHPLLSLAEARAVLGGEKPEVIEPVAVFEREDWDGAMLQDRLAGTVKLGDDVLDVAVKNLTAERICDLIEEKKRAERVLFGMTIIGEGKTRFDKLPLQVKKALKERGRSSRWVTGDRGDLSPAAVSKLHLTDEGYDFVVVLTKNRAMVCLTTHVQDADAWSKRDFGRPFRDATTGMLPPKLARMMVNLGVAQPITRNPQQMTILDPFCGGGTILMEAALMKTGPVIGADNDPRQVAGCKENMEWMAQEGMINRETGLIEVMQQDATSIDQRLKNRAIDAVVTEGYLGKPLQGNEPLAFLGKQKLDIEELWRNTLRSLAKILKSGAPVVCVWPVFVAKGVSVAVDLKKDLSGLGFALVNPLEEWTDKPVTLTYARPDQHVKRNIVTLKKI